MEHSIQQLAKAAGTTSRTLRHYGSIGLLPPSRVGANGYRYYDERSLVRLQRILLLRELGLGLDAIGQVLATQDAQGAGPEAEAAILTHHLDLLRQEREQLAARIGAVERTIAVLEGGSDTREGEGLMAENIYEGFDHAQYREEVEQRWGADAYAKSDRWWRGMSEAEQRSWQERVAQLSADWTAAAAQGEDPTGQAAQDLAARHVEWLKGIGGTPAAAPGGDLEAYVLGLADMYVADDRFAANYGGAEGAEFVRDALRHYVAGGAAG